MKTRKPSFVAAACLSLALLLPLTAAASPPDNALIPENAKWVIHVDLEALGQGTLADSVRQERPQMVEMIQRFMQENYGINPQEDLKSLTMFSDSYAEHTGTMILKAKYDPQRVQTFLAQRPDIQQQQLENLTAYTVTGTPPGLLQLGAQQRGLQPGRQPQAAPQQQPGAIQQQPGAVQQQPGAIQQQPGAAQQQPGAAQQQPGARQPALQQRGAQQQQQQAGAQQQQAGQPQMTIVLVDDSTVVFASSPDRARSAVELVRGDASTVSEDSPLMSEFKEEAVIYGAAIDLEELEQRDGIFPLLSQHEKIVWTVRKENDEVIGHLKLNAKSEEVAEQMKTTLEGSIAFAQVLAGESENLKKLAESREVSRDGKVVEATGRGDTETLLAAARELRDRLEQRVGADNANN